MVGVLKLTGEFPRPKEEMITTHLHTIFMGQTPDEPALSRRVALGSTEWIDSGALVERCELRIRTTRKPRQPGRPEHG